MKVQSLLISSLIAFQATSANGRMSRPGSPANQPPSPPDDVVIIGGSGYERFGSKLGVPQGTLDTIEDIFGEDLVDDLQDDLNDFQLFFNDLPGFLFNGVADLLIPIVNDIIKLSLMQFDPLDLEIEEEIPLGTVYFGDICEAVGDLVFSLDPLVGISDLSIDDVALVNHGVQVGFWQTKVDFTIRMTGSGSDTGFLSGVNLDIFANICGANTQGGTSAALSIVGPTVSVDFSVRGNLGLFGSSLLVEQVELSNVKVAHEEVNTLMDANNVGEDTAVGAESDISNTVEIELTEAEDNIAKDIRDTGNEQLRQMMPLEVWRMS